MSVPKAIDAFDPGLVLTTTDANAPANNSQVTIARESKRGFVAAVTVQALQATPHGRVYCQVSLIRASTDVPIPLWSGYVLFQEGCTSTPTIYATPRDRIQAVFTFGQGAASSQIYQVKVDFVADRDYLPAGPFFFFEPAGSGTGEVFTDTQSPAPGAESFLQVMAWTRWRIRSIRWELAVANSGSPRTFSLFRKGKSAGFLQAWALETGYFKAAPINATTDWTVANSAITEGAKDDNAGYPGFACDMILNGQANAVGDRIGTLTVGLVAGDQWKRTETYEEWAMPSP